VVWAVSLSTMKLIPHCLTATLLCNAIWSLIEFGNPVRPLAHSELYLHYKTRDAAPKCISRRTSYLRVRLAFHRYPQLIQAVFNRHWFGPPLRVTAISTWPWVDHPVSGLLHATEQLIKVVIRPIRTRFRCGSVPEGLNLATYSNSQAHSAKGTPSDCLQK
jgi:hypothetical protein